MTSEGVKPFFFLTTSRQHVPSLSMNYQRRINDLDDQIHRIQKTLLDAGTPPETIEAVVESLSRERLELARWLDLQAAIRSRREVELRPEELAGALLTIRSLVGETQVAWGRRLGVGGPQTMRYERGGYDALTWGRMIQLLVTLPVKVAIHLTWDLVDAGSE